MTSPLKISNLHVHIPIGNETIRAIDGIDIELGEREILAIVGESGSGKSMTARSILRLLPSMAQTRGAVILEGRDVMTADATALRRVRGSSAAMVFQEPSTALNPVYKVGWQIAEGLRAHGIHAAKERRRRAIEMLKAVGIPDPEVRVDYYPHQFSGGQKQRVVIAMALALGPSVIIADEPTTALDVTVQAEILDLLRRCRDELNASIIIITHNMGVVADLADRVAVMYQGKIVEQANVEALFAAPKDDYTKHLLASVPFLGKGSQILEAATHSPDAAKVPVLTVQDLQITYRSGVKRFRAVEGVSFEIAPREVLGLVGESGSGKSTIGRSLVGLAPVTGGSISFFGVEVNGASSKTLRALRRRIGFVFQDPASSFNPHMTISDCISEPIRVHRSITGESEIQKRVAKLLDYVQLSRDFASRHPYELSGGQRQRVGLARALALDPEFVIADEPTSALDVSVQARVLKIFKELQAEFGFAMLFISHDLGVVEQVADRVGVLKSGNLLEIGKTRQVLLAPRHKYTQNLISAVPIPDPLRQRERRLKRKSAVGDE